MTELKIMADSGHIAWDMERFQFLGSQDEFDRIHSSYCWNSFHAARTTSRETSGSKTIQPALPLTKEISEVEAANLNKCLGSLHRDRNCYSILTDGAV